VFVFLALLVAFGLGYFAGHTAERNVVQITKTQLVEVQTNSNSPAAVPAQQNAHGPIDINTADKSLLESLPGVGTVLAERILEYRAKHGSFLSIEELKQVEGIGEKKFDGIKELITAGGAK